MHRKYTMYCNKKVSWPVSVTKQRFEELLKLETVMRQRYETHIDSLNLDEHYVKNMRVDIFDYTYEDNDMQDEDDENIHDKEERQDEELVNGKKWGHVHKIDL